MYLKFKTILFNKLVSCSVNYIKNQIISEKGIIIGRIEDRGEETPKVLPVFQFTGRKDKDGEEIYIDHKIQIIIEVNDGEFHSSQRYVFWDGDSISLKSINSSSFITNSLGNYPDDKIKIIGHRFFD